MVDLMKFVKICAFAGMMLITLALSAQGQNATPTQLLHYLYFSSLAYPENFDASVELLEASGRKEEIHKCLVPLRTRYRSLGQTNIRQCERIVDPEGRWDCIKKNSSSTMFYWLYDIALLLDDKVESWLQTLTGGRMYRAKQLMEAIQPGTWVQSIKFGMPLVKRMIYCSNN